MKIKESIRKNPECKVYPHSGIPVIEDGLKMPNDLKGVTIYEMIFYGDSPKKKPYLVFNLDSVKIN